MKVRVWNKYRKWMESGDDLYMDLDGNLYDAYWEGALEIERQNSSNYIILEYTEIDDDNGTEIYKGDLLRIWIDGVEQDNLYEVKGAKELYFDINREDSYLAITKCIVEGNIYQK